MDPRNMTQSIYPSCRLRPGPSGCLPQHRADDGVASHTSRTDSLVCSLLAAPGPNRGYLRGPSPRHTLRAVLCYA